MRKRGECVALVFGALAPSLASQLDAKKAHQIVILKPFQQDADSIVRLSVRGLLTARETDRARRRLIQQIREEVDKGYPD